MSHRFDKVVVVGAGLIGASLAGAGRSRGLFGWVTAVGRSRANLDRAVGAGLVDEGTRELEPALADADLIIIATPVDSALDLLNRVVAVSPKTALISDVGSVKGPICTRASDLGIESRFVGSHPMAGGVASGAAWADTSLFEGRVVALTPAGSSKTALAKLSALWQGVGAVVVEMPPGVHDSAVAFASHLPQFTAYALAATAEAKRGDAMVARLAGAGMRDTTRLAASNADMWLAVAALNKREIVAALEAMSSALDQVKAAVDSGDRAALAAIIERARRFAAGNEA